MRFAMTGATGFIGRRLARLLVFEGHDVVAVVRDPGRAADLARFGVSLVVGDVTSRTSLLPAFDGADGVFHLAGWYRIGIAEPEAAWAINVQGTRNTMDAARSAGVSRVVHTSTLAVNSDTKGAVVDETYRFSGRHLTLYERTKAEAHRFAVAYADRGLDVVITMPGGVYGPDDTSVTGELIRRTARGERVVAPAGLRMCMAHVDDIATGHLQSMLLGRGGDSYMLAGPQASLVDVLTLVAEISGGRPPLVAPDPLIMVGSRLMAAGSRLPVPAAYTAESLRASRATYLGCPRKAQEELGWSARDLPTGLRQTVQEERSPTGTMVP